MINQFKIIEASAGTGKTFSLSSQLILLMASGIHPSKILALTFTKKAAGEIRNRVYERLARAALNSNAAAELSNQIGKFSTSKETYAEILNSILSDNKRINISTIDGFFNQIAKLLPTEFLLPINWKISDQNQHKKLATDSILRAFSQSKEQQREMLSLLQLLNRDEISKTILGKALDLTESYIDNLNNIEHFEFEIENSFELENLKDFAEKIKNYKTPLNKDGSLNKRFNDAILKSIKYILEKDWEGFLSNGIPNAILDKKKTYYNAEITLELLSLFNTPISIAKSQVLTKFREKTLSTRRLLELIRSNYLELKHQQGLVTFNDIQNTLENNNYNHEELYARLDNRYDHILIDEFQDTSFSQWKILEPFIEELISLPSKTCFVVGDKKQAIYGWRGGKSAIFDNFKNKYPQSKVDQLNKSYRSSQIIIDNVNRIFKNLLLNPALTDYPRVAKKWANNFITHTTDIDLPGYVKYEIVDENFDLSKELQNIVKEELKIGILVQTNQEVQDVIETLAKSKPPIKASMEGGTSLAQSDVIRVLLASIRLIDNPFDTELFFIVCSSSLNVSFLEINTKNSSEYSNQLLCELENNGFAKLVQRIADELSILSNYSEQLKLNKVVELAYLFEDSDYTLFCEMVEQTKFLAASDQQIRVMTIHQSKGLEFDIVVLPCLNTGINKNNSKIIIKEESQDNPKILPYPKELIRSLSSEINSVYQELQESRVDESLAVLYVALTRAKTKLYVYLTKSRGLTLESILSEEFSSELSNADFYEIQ